jgi:phenylalanyl-tRNA synthetase beta chain
VVTVGTVAVARAYDVRPSVLAAFDLPHRAAAAIVDLAALAALTGTVTKAAPIPMRPAITYDLTFRRAHADAVGPLLAKLRAASPMLESVVVRDLYDGKTPDATPGTYSVTLRFTYRAADRTLTEQEAKAEHEKVLGAHGLAAAAT